MAKESEIAARIGLKQDTEPLRFLAEAGFLWLDLRNVEEATLVFEALIALAPEDPTGHLGLGDAKRMREDYGGALASYDAAAHCANNGPRSLAMVFRKQGETHALDKDAAKAIQAFERVIALDPSSDEAATAAEYIAALNRKPDLPTSAGNSQGKQS